MNDETRRELEEFRKKMEAVQKIGYLSGSFQHGSVPQEFLRKLRVLDGFTRDEERRREHPRTRRLLSFGHHECEYCGNARSSGDTVLDEKWRWPDMLLHYIEVHGYQPPQEFIDYVLGIDI